jgi:Concanavalin A-like lectin/glucanases superfamily/Domain of unknown function (DUF2341)
MRILILVAFQILFPVYHKTTAAYYRSLTMDHTQAGTVDTPNYPLVFLGNASLATVANGGRVTSSSGFDIIFCTSPVSHSACLGSLLKFERVSWSATTGLGEFWIQVPTLSHSSNTVIYVYYGDSTITTDQENVNGTWDANFAAVYHFGTASSLALTDSTSNANTCTNHGATAGAGQIGGSANFVSASTQYLDCGSGASLKITGTLTVETWAKYTGSAANQAGISNNASTTGYLFAPKWSGLSVALWDLQNSGVESSLETLSTLTYTNAIYFASTYTPGTNFAINVPFTANTSSAVPTASTLGAGSNLNLGRHAGSFYYDGFLDEVRISNVVRSPSYILATSNNANTSSTFITVGSEVHI